MWLRQGCLRQGLILVKYVIYKLSHQSISSKSVLLLSLLRKPKYLRASGWLRCQVTSISAHLLAECMFLKGEFFFLYTCETTAHLDSPDIFSLGLCLSKASFQARSINSSLLFFEEKLALMCFYWGQTRKCWSQSKADLHHKEQREKQLQSLWNAVKQLKQNHSTSVSNALAFIWGLNYRRRRAQFL